MGPAFDRTNCDAYSFRKAVEFCVKRRMRKRVIGKGRERERVIKREIVLTI